MISFADRVEAALIPHGVAADRLNKDVTNMLMEVYIEGLRDWDMETGSEENQELLKEAIALVRKRKAPLSANALETKQ